jgi:membrane-bound ClpP family serine protease
MHEKRILILRLKNFENINLNFLIIILMLFGSILLAISAKVQVPF